MNVRKYISTWTEYVQWVAGDVEKICRANFPRWGREFKYRFKMMEQGKVYDDVSSMPMDVYEKFREEFLTGHKMMSWHEWKNS